MALLLSLSLYPRREIQRRSFRVCKFSGSNQLTQKSKKRNHEPLRRHEEPRPGRRRRRHRREEPTLLPQAAPPGRTPPVPPEQQLRRGRRHGSARPTPVKGRREQSFGGVPAAASVLRLASAAGLEPGGARQPVRHGLSVQSPAVVAGDVASHPSAGGGPSYPTPGGTADVAPFRSRVRSRVPASRPR